MTTPEPPTMTDDVPSPSYPPPAPPAPPTRAPPQPPPSSSPRIPLPIPPSTPSTEAFFARHNQPPTARQLCWDFVSSHYPSTSNTLTVHECPTQGYCSYTLCISDSQIIQFRPGRHQLNTTLSLLAREVYGVLAPETRFLGVLPVPFDPTSGDDDHRPPPEPMFVYAMTCMPGISLTSFRLHPPASAGEVRLQRAILVRDFARFLSLGWKSRQQKANLPFRGGRLAGSLRKRLEMMRDGLPLRFRPVVVDCLKDLEGIEGLPWVLTHGDVVGDNVMVEGAGDGGGSGGGGSRGTGWWPGTLRGMIDWAESEYLPFGVGLYGVEELFGQSVRRWDEEGKGEGVVDRFVYYPEAGDLRRLFWQELEGAVPPLATDRGLRAAVEQARVLGILLWHGFAFDDGRIDRVVQEGRDEGEVQRLDMFLFGSDHPLARGDADSRVAAAATAGEKDGAARREGRKKPLVTVAEAGTEKEGGKGRGLLSRRISKMIL